MFRRRAESWERLLRLIERFRERGAISLNRAVTIEDLGLPPRFKDAVNSPLVDILSAEVGRFLHRATSRLEGTCVLAFTHSWLRGYLHGLRHQPLNGSRRAVALSKPYIQSLLEPPPPISAWSPIPAFGYPGRI